MFWNVASARDEILLRKYSGGTGHLRIFRRSVGCKKCALLAAMLLYTLYKPGVGKFVHWMVHLQKLKTPESRKTSL